MKNIISFFVLSVVAVQTAFGIDLKVLAIGNSFSQDAIEQHLYELAAAQGDTLLLGNAYIPGCSIEKHVDCLDNDKHVYSYRKVVDGVKQTTPDVALKDIIADEPWQVISLQQASHFSGKSDTYVLLPRLHSEVVRLMPRKDAELVWHMTWSYAKDSDHSGFPYYGNSQRAMDDSIRAAVYNFVIPEGLTKIIPAGPAISLGREVFGDVMNIDGYHLSHDLGRYTAACVWCEFLTGKSVIGNPYHPSNMTAEQALKAQQAAHAAIAAYR